ncbi:HAD family phosphatase [Planctomycetales bacterium ZRK34]|nr:HAD family phosphatase [Planctomycetales bacterium ZRK34]
MSQAVIFDVDGVLIDSYQAHYESWRALCREHGFDITETQFATTFGRRSSDIIAMLFEGEFTDEQIAAMDDRKEALFREIVERDFPAMDGAVELIDDLAGAGFKLALGSSGPPDNVMLVLRKLDRVMSVGAVVTGQDVTRGKPDPQVFQTAAQRLVVDPSHCVVVEDAVPGIEAAKRAGMKAVALTGTAPREQLEAAGADQVVDSLRELGAGQMMTLLSK